MARITAKQITSVNSKCSNGWVMNVLYYSSFGEKTLIKRITLDEKNFLEFTLSYNSDNQISLRISKYSHEPNETFAVSTGLGKSVILDETQAKRKSVNNLIAFTEKLTDEKLLELEKDSKETDSKGVVQS